MRSDTKSRQEEYISRLVDLYADVEIWTEGSDLRTKQGKMELHEEAPGRYQVPTLAIRDVQGNKLADLVPVGAWIIGAEGRVDMVGSMDVNSLVYLKAGGPAVITKEVVGGRSSEDRPTPLFKGVKGAGWYWIEDKRLGRARPLSKQLFLDLLSEVSDHGV